MKSYYLSCYDTQNILWPIFLKAKLGGNLELFTQILSKTMMSLTEELSALIECQQTIYLCPIPLRQSSLLKRGYSPQHLFAESIAHHIGRPFMYAPTLLKRVRQTLPQTGQSKADRMKSQVGSMAYRGPSRCPIILVDDVVTTGSTFKEAKRALTANQSTPLMYLSMFVTNHMVNHRLPLISEQSRF